MAQAYVLLNCELGAEEEIIGKLKELETVKEVHGTFGAYDITVKLEAETAEMLRETITQNLRKMDKIRSTLTLTVVEEQG
ncbi:MAG: Lrp/AsnC ligand binding domain-containing protein [Candidatus Nitrosopelagicus sp.]|jgi:DNA-binding Lrp family transcriptional regulator|nr:Lrp/AsnC ligand binding domain-containing protein [Candidatus Nitrosopelagicus sp.]